MEHGDGSRKDDTMGGWYIDPVASASVYERESAVKEHLVNCGDSQAGQPAVEAVGTRRGMVTFFVHALLGLQRTVPLLRPKQQ